MPRAITPWPGAQATHRILRLDFSLGIKEVLALQGKSQGGKCTESNSDVSRGRTADPGIKELGSCH